MSRPKGSAVINGENGWLSPRGLFYRCACWGHINLAAKLTRDGIGRDLSMRGWVTISGNKAFPPWRKSITQPQLDVLFDWYNQRGEDLPAWAAVD